jgi:hypothetical protein
MSTVTPLSDVVKLECGDGTVGAGVPITVVVSFLSVIGTGDPRLRSLEAHTSNARQRICPIRRVRALRRGRVDPDRAKAPPTHANADQLNSEDVHA